MGETNPSSQAIMFTARQKIKKERGAQPNDLENQVAQAFVDLEINNEELRPTLKNLHIVAAREVRVNNSTAAIVVFVPYRLRELFRKNQVRLVCELEKKFSGQHVVLVAQRKIQDKEKHSNRKASKGQVRPRSRTLTAVHDAVMADVVYPANISGKRTPTRWTATSKSKLSSRTDMKSARSSTPSPLCTLPSPARAPASLCLPQRSKLAF